MPWGRLELLEINISFKKVFTTYSHCHYETSFSVVFKGKNSNLIGREIRFDTNRREKGTQLLNIQDSACLYDRGDDIYKDSITYDEGISIVLCLRVSSGENCFKNLLK